MSLGKDADVLCYNNHLELFNAASADRDLIRSFACVIVGRYFRQIELDVVTSNISELLKAQGSGPILLNWQGYITKEEVNKKFDGKLFHRYGVKWQTLRLRIQRYEKSMQPHTDGVIKPFTNSEASPLRASNAMPNSMFENISRPERCMHILRIMSKNSSGRHKEKIDSYLHDDPKTGMRLLEAIYERLLTDRDRPDNCPSRYINSSPLIAKRILREALFH